MILPYSRHWSPVFDSCSISCISLGIISPIRIALANCSPSRAFYCVLQNNKSSSCKSLRYRRSMLFTNTVSVIYCASKLHCVSLEFWCTINDEYCILLYRLEEGILSTLFGIHCTTPMPDVEAYDIIFCRHGTEQSATELRACCHRREQLQKLTNWILE